jgi:trimeric autotransporter adhesin
MIALMQRSIVELSRGSANQTRAFQQLGLSLRDLQGLSPDQQFERIATALSGVEDPAQRTALAMEVFGRSGRAAINMLDGYTDALADARRFQDAFGLSVSQGASDAIERANDALGRLSMGFRGLGNILASELAPRMERFANSMIETIIQTNAIQRTASVLVALFERIGFYAGAAAVAFGAYKVATIAATVATVGLSTALGVARAALIRLGLGVIIVAAGELAFRVSKLIEATGGWGNALSLLGDVASGVWEGIKTSASSIGPALGSVWQGVKATFFELMESLTAKWRDFLSMLAGTVSGLPGGDVVFNRLSQAAADADASVTRFMRSANDAEESAISLRRQAGELATLGFDRATAALRRLNTTVETNTENTEDGTDAANALNTALENVTDTTGGAASAVGDLSEKLQQVPQWVNGVSDAFADLVMRGFRDFRSFAQSVVNTFRNMLRDMIALAARNRIMISLGMGGMATPAMAGTGLPGVSGLVGSFGGGSGLAGFAGGTGFLGGMGNVIGGFASGGFAGAGGAISTAIAGATSGIAGFAAAAGALVLPLAAAAAVFSLFRTKTKELDSGLNITIGNMDALVETFRTVEKSRFFGLSKSRSTTVSGASAEVADPISAAVFSMQQGAINAANVLGIGAEAFEGFSHRINLSLKGLNEQQAMQKVTEELTKMGDAFASLAPGVSNMNELLGAAQQRYDLTTRLLAASRRRRRIAAAASRARVERGA